MTDVNVGNKGANDHSSMGNGSRLSFEGDGSSAFPRLSFSYYSKVLIRHIGAIIERVIKVDYNTSTVEMGKFARLVILVDLNRLFVPRIKLDVIYQKLKYEGLQIIYFLWDLWP
ncbi:hypothetical protein V6N12_066580 [Hibiscus sabdariffa]|uniref:Uncharacterized protein n=1 Tax=Hibiscus sabdariffa TaxID=183260 RepID=A0ABR2CQJ0_9ROSI